MYYEMTADLVLRYVLYFAKLTISVLICNHAVHSKLGLNHLCFQKTKSKLLHIEHTEQWKLLAVTEDSRN